MSAFTITCPRCQGGGQVARYKGVMGECYRCSGSGRLPEPSLSSGSIRRWVKIAHVLAARPDSSGRDVDDALENAYGRASVAGVLGAMRESNLTDKDSSSPARWRLTPDGFLWQQLYCRECLTREPRHKKTCSAPSPIAVLGSLPGQSGKADALESLLGTVMAEDEGDTLELAVALVEGTARIRVLGTQVELKLPVADCKIDAVKAVALGEAIAQAGRQAQGSHGQAL